VIWQPQPFLSIPLDTFWQGWLEKALNKKWILLDTPLEICRKYNPPHPQLYTQATSEAYIIADHQEALAEQFPSRIGRKTARHFH
jgi:hypothetical protein